MIAPQKVLVLMTLAASGLACNQQGNMDAGMGMHPKDAALADTSIAADASFAPDASVLPDASGALDATPSDASALDAAPDAAPDAALDAGARDATPVDASIDGGMTGVCPLNSTASNAFTGHVYGATSYGPSVVPVYDVTTGTRSAPAPFAMVGAAGWLGPLHIESGRFISATNLNHGTVFDISGGGSFTSTRTAIATNIFPSLMYIEGLAIDPSTGNIYLTNSENGLQPIAVVTPQGAVSHLARMYDNASGLAVCGRKLMIAEANAGNVVAYDLVSHSETVFARGFRPGNTHVSAQLVVDRRGHLLVFWSTAMNTSTGIFDISAGGDFSTRTASVTSSGFSTDVNQLAVNASNDVLVAGDSGGSLWISRLRNGQYQPFVTFATSLGDNESVAVGP
jgi:hypothetical protein